MQSAVSVFSQEYDAVTDTFLAPGRTDDAEQLIQIVADFLFLTANAAGIILTENTLTRDKEWKGAALGIGSEATAFIILTRMLADM